MKHWMLLTLALTSFGLAWGQPYKTDVIEETLYQEFRENLLSPHKKMLSSGFTPFEQKLFVDAIWDLAEEDEVEALKALDSLTTVHFDLTEKLRIGILRMKYKRISRLSDDLADDLMKALLAPAPEVKILYLLASYEDILLKGGHTDIIEMARKFPPYYDVAHAEGRRQVLRDDLVTDLFFNSPDTTTFMNGEYARSVKIFMFCRQNRLYPCLMAMRDSKGEVVRTSDGTIWTHKSLASSKHGFPSHVRNGNTPTGVLTIDSVMPVADQQVSFGKFRRIILNFVPKSANEALIKSLLPPSSHRENWWKNSVTARDVGRNLFRIHGTGKRNTEPEAPYYPFMQTSGCIAQRENTYDGVSFKDQRQLLDAIMMAMEYSATYENEVRVKGILYLVELDDKEGPVEVEDLLVRGID